MFCRASRQQRSDDITALFPSGPLTRNERTIPGAAVKPLFGSYQ